MKSGGRNYFIIAVAAGFHVALVAGILLVSWIYVPGDNPPSANLEGSVEPQRPVTVRTVAIGKASLPPLPSGPEIRYEPSLGIKRAPSYSVRPSAEQPVTEQPLTVQPITVQPIIVRTIAIKAPPALQRDVRERPALAGGPFEPVEFVPSRRWHPHVLPPLKIMK